ncbi:hypothetical protein [Bacillus halotolerans]|uniref:hypothetical protein n=1 Tax=Bacillus halotolerans TaxID=260554 RepID=UPI00273C456D|nr:hypothetical protein [Bacillus halotolerans]MDP4525195.1 hypothetical protein [Bacillus halotolerans]MEC1606121.1 hypothetical protein [Bacillus halotolerans]
MEQKLGRNLKIPKINLELPKLNYPPPDLSYIKKINEQIASERQQKEQAIKQREKDEKEYREQTLQLLSGIERNTAILHEISLLMRTSNEKQDEIFTLIVEMLEVLKSANQEEAVSKYRKIMDKISKFKGDTDTIKSLYSVGSAILTMINTLNS